MARVKTGVSMKRTAHYTPMADIWQALAPGKEFRLLQGILAPVHPHPDNAINKSAVAGATTPGQVIHSDSLQRPSCQIKLGLVLLFALLAHASG
jgi:hypothetical protein